MIYFPAQFSYTDIRCELSIPVCHLPSGSDCDKNCTYCGVHHCKRVAKNYVFWGIHVGNARVVEDFTVIHVPTSTIYITRSGC